MYSAKIYNSWEELQKEKYTYILKSINISPFLKGPTADIGIGSGFFEEFLQQRRIKIKNIIGIDKNEEMIKKQKIKIKNIIADANSLPFKSKLFGLIICLDVIHTINKTDEMKRILKKGGHILISIFCNIANVEKVAEEVKEKMNGLTLVKKFIIEGKEMELIFLFKK